MSASVATCKPIISSKEIPITSIPNSFATPQCDGRATGSHAEPILVAEFPCGAAPDGVLGNAEDRSSVAISPTGRPPLIRELLCVWKETGCLSTADLRRQA